MQVWTQRVTNNTNKEMAELRKEMNKKLEKMREVENNRRIRSVPSRGNVGQNTSRIETPKHRDDGDDELNASDIKNQENRTQDNLFRPSETNELRTPTQPISIQNLVLDDTIIMQRV